MKFINYVIVQWKPWLLLTGALCGKNEGEIQAGIKYRVGERKDSKKLAELINIASDGVVEYLFHNLIPGMTPI